MQTADVLSVALVFFCWWEPSGNDDGDWPVLGGGQQSLSWCSRSMDATGTCPDRIYTGGTSAGRIAFSEGSNTAELTHTQIHTHIMTYEIYIYIYTPVYIYIYTRYEYCLCIRSHLTFAERQSSSHFSVFLFLFLILRFPVSSSSVSTCQVDACVDAFLDGEAFDRLPDVPLEFLASGQVSSLISYHDGHVASTQFHKVRELPSVVFLEEHLHAGHRVEKTIDLFSLVGMCVMVHSDPGVLANDVQAIRQMENNGSLFVLSN